MSFGAPTLFPTVEAPTFFPTEIMEAITAIENTTINGIKLYGRLTPESYYLNAPGVLVDLRANFMYQMKDTLILNADHIGGGVSVTVGSTEAADVLMAYIQYHKKLYELEQLERDSKELERLKRLEKREEEEEKTKTDPIIPLNVKKQIIKSLLPNPKP